MSFPGAFSAKECEAIEALFESHAEVEHDVRESYGISRRNRWLPRDVFESSEFAWVADRVLEHVSGDDDRWGFGGDAPRGSAEFLKRHVEFVLMHEFRDGDFFDWHVDAEPDQSSLRTLNVNVALSDPEAFEGGALQVGGANATLRRGDLHVYPASFPHKVHDVVKGRRRTLVVATRCDVGTDADADVRRAYWRAAERRFGDLCDSDLGAAHAKLHWIFGEFLEKTGDVDRAKRKFADSYRTTPERLAYARSFADKGAERHDAGDAGGAADDLEMATLVDPETVEYRVDHGILRWRLGHLDVAEAQLRAALDLDDAPGVRAALSLVLRDAGRADDAAKERRAAFDADAAEAQGALDALDE